jgi:hypothetical protein
LFPEHASDPICDTSELDERCFGSYSSPSDMCWRYCKLSPDPPGECATLYLPEHDSYYQCMEEAETDAAKTACCAYRGHPDSYRCTSYLSECNQSDFYRYSSDGCYEYCHKIGPTAPDWCAYDFLSKCIQSTGDPRCCGNNQMAPSYPEICSPQLADCHRQDGSIDAGFCGSHCSATYQHPEPEFCHRVEFEYCQLRYDSDAYCCGWASKYDSVDEIQGFADVCPQAIDECSQRPYNATSSFCRDYCDADMEVDWCGPYILDKHGHAPSAYDCGQFWYMHNNADHPDWVEVFNKYCGNVNSCENGGTDEEWCRDYCHEAWDAGDRPSFCATLFPDEIEFVSDCYPPDTPSWMKYFAEAECCAKYPGFWYCADSGGPE